ncbi:response regulator [Rhodocytophaga rosea]|uniref:Response regulator n=1 Tax=Rhodocytophaga rosea TaxID=2704465 RepID=A0A6C0GTA5_9BACT|nr:response regulator [Rhodocytophaga rosea]QHT71256.1 response regulator [Rhodocytophaga rosea]
MERIRQLLIIDDDLASRRLMVEAAKELFVHTKIITYPNALDALSYITTYCIPTLDNPHVFCPELILLDVNLPVIDGYEFLSELHSIEGLQHNNTSILLVSSLPYEKEKRKVALFPVLGYLEKPVTLENLRFALKNILPE